MILPDPQFLPICPQVNSAALIGAKERRIAEHGRRLTDLSRRLVGTERTLLRNFRQSLEGVGGKLHTLSPTAVLGRGYSITQVLPAGEVVRRASQLKMKDRVKVRVQKGEFIARVEKIKGPPESD